MTKYCGHRFQQETEGRIYSQNQDSTRNPTAICCVPNPAGVNSDEPAGCGASVCGAGSL